MTSEQYKMFQAEEKACREELNALGLRISNLGNRILASHDGWKAHVGMGFAEAVGTCYRASSVLEKAWEQVWVPKAYLNEIMAKEKNS